MDVRDLAAFMLDQVEAGTDGVFNVTGPEGVLTMGDLLGACVAARDADTETIWVGLNFLRERGLREVGEHGWEQLPYWYPELAGFCAFDVSKAVHPGERAPRLLKYSDGTMRELPGGVDIELRCGHFRHAARVAALALSSRGGGRLGLAGSG